MINAGGVINIAVELEPEGYNEARALAKGHRIYKTVQDVFDMAERDNIATNRAALLLAERKLAAARQRKESASVNGW